MTRSTALVFFGLIFASDAYGQQTIGGCSVLPANNIWNTPVDTLPVLSNSDDHGEHDRRQPRLPCRLRRGHVGRRTDWHSVHHRARHADEIPGVVSATADESDPGPYAIPLNAPIEGGSAATGDRHAIAVDVDNCILYELYRAFPQASSWSADSGAIFDLRSNALAPGDLDVGRRRGPADHAGAGHLRRGAERRDQTRDPFHRAADAARIRVARAALRLVADGHAVSADGRALPAEGELQHHDVIQPTSRSFCAR